MAVKIIFTLLSILVLSSCNTTKETKSKIGVILPMSGSVSLYGENELKGIKIALKEINEANIDPLYEIILEDSKGDPMEAVTAYKKLRGNDKIKYFITSLTGVSLAIKELTKKQQAIQIALSMEETIPLKTTNVFRIYPGILEEGQSLLKTLLMDKPKSIAIIYFKQTAFENQIFDILKPGLERNSVEISAIESFRGDISSNLRSIAIKLRNKKPAVIYIGAYYSQMQDVFRILGEYKLLNQSKIVSGLNLLVAINSGLLEPSAAEGSRLVLPKFSYLLEDSINKTEYYFLKEYKKEFNTEPNFDAAYAYEATKILLNSIKNSGNDLQKTINLIKSTKNINSTVGNLSISEDGNSSTEWVTADIKNGRIIIR